MKEEQLYKCHCNLVNKIFKCFYLDRKTMKEIDISATNYNALINRASNRKLTSHKELLRIREKLKMIRLLRSRS
ncbi:hypothetical protein [Paenibacillus macquariensis]|uniref:Uncharacterized protein n=1 Tax=Paenibacillus macquariensis TaxID=948756 RepID=A0ABY1JKD2_9BACL|nr:hypothetical protein [Paenibacillus macquariensis]MEC0089906.1 hypothetical protein [Paenibacillus macquariensis]OAB31202.1 hypothetical protein PMSM_21010 [Paenibacillus macquariensis subsp. macquariensis]SIQ34024.1 hypothetical protein SAMN05421578_101292 [Paenibacillus macquariensis]